MLYPCFTRFHDFHNFWGKTVFGKDDSGFAVAKLVGQLRNGVHRIGRNYHCPDFVTGLQQYDIFKDIGAHQSDPFTFLIADFDKSCCCLLRQCIGFGIGQFIISPDEIGFIRVFSHPFIEIVFQGLARVINGRGYPLVVKFVPYSVQFNSSFAEYMTGAGFSFLSSPFYNNFC